MTISLKCFPPSWIQIKTEDSIIYIDPAYLRTYFTKHPHKIEFSKWPDPIDGLPEKLEKADIILITHDHADHCKKITADRLRSKNTLVIGPKRSAKKLGNDLRVIASGEEISFGEIKIMATYAYNTREGSSTQKVHHKGIGVGFRITANGKTIYHAGDTDFIPEMKQIGPIDVALLPIGGTYTMNINEAVKAAMTINPIVAIPMHHLKADPQEFEKKIEAKSDVRGLPLRIGEIYRLN
jgi:L-ascorbate metabolism protein UlaG (beta-lactamase superfamily)